MSLEQSKNHVVYVVPMVGWLAVCGQFCQSLILYQACLLLHILRVEVSFKPRVLLYTVAHYIFFVNISLQCLGTSSNLKEEQNISCNLSCLFTLGATAIIWEDFFGTYIGVYFKINESQTFLYSTNLLLTHGPNNRGDSQKCNLLTTGIHISDFDNSIFTIILVV